MNGDFQTGGSGDDGPPSVCPVRAAVAQSRPGHRAVDGHSPKGLAEAGDKRKRPQSR